MVKSTRQKEDAERANLLYEVFGNPYCPALLKPSWRTAAVLAAARGAYTRGLSLNPGHLDTSRLSRLAALLEKAGCDDRLLLDHLRFCRPARPRLLGVGLSARQGVGSMPNQSLQQTGRGLRFSEECRLARPPCC